MSAWPLAICSNSAKRMGGMCISGIKVISAYVISSMCQTFIKDVLLYLLVCTYLFSGTSDSPVGTHWGDLRQLGDCFHPRSFALTSVFGQSRIHTTQSTGQRRLWHRGQSQKQVWLVPIVQSFQFLQQRSWYVLSQYHQFSSSCDWRICGQKHWFSSNKWLGTDFFVCSHDITLTK